MPKYGLHLGFLVNADMYARMVSAAKARNQTVSDVIRAALEHHLPGSDYPPSTMGESAPHVGENHPAMAAQASG